MGVPKDYEDCYAYLSAQFPEVGGCEFYSELFPDNEKAGELHTDFSRPNAIYLYRDEARGRERRRIMLKDTWEQDYMEYVEQNPLTLCSGLVYRRRANKLQNAQRMNALIFVWTVWGGRSCGTCFCGLVGSRNACGGCLCRLSLCCLVRGFICIMFFRSRWIYSRILRCS